MGKDIHIGLFFSDRNLILSSTSKGLLMCGFFIFVPMYSNLPWIIIPSLLVLSQFFNFILSQWSKYKNLKFVDEKIPENANLIKNAVLYFSFPVMYLISMVTFFYLDNLGYNLDRYLWILTTDIIYFIGILCIFIEKIATEE
jgi:hypothetical protein